MPRPKRWRPKIGEKVQVREAMETRGGTKFPVGMVCTVYSTNGAGTKVSLSAPNPDETNIFGPRSISIRDVGVYNVEPLKKEVK